jgi:predicted ATPase
MPVSELIGRDTDLEKVLRIARAHPLVTLTGIGGIGKTMLALALARELRPYFADGVWLAEFSAVGDAWLVPATIAAAVGLELGGGEVSAQRVAQALADRRLLLVLDTCEHVIAAIAKVAEAMLGISSAPHIIAPSRPLAARRYEQGANGSIQSNPSPCQRRMSRLSTISCNTALFGCSSSG